MMVSLDMFSETVGKDAEAETIKRFVSFGSLYSAYMLSSVAKRRCASDVAGAWNGTFE